MNFGGFLKFRSRHKIFQFLLIAVALAFIATNYQNCAKHSFTTETPESTSVQDQSSTGSSTNSSTTPTTNPANPSQTQTTTVTSVTTVTTTLLSPTTTLPRVTTTTTLPPVIDVSQLSKTILFTPEEKTEPMKIVFVIDNSNTMSANQLNLQKGIDSLMQNISDLNSEIYLLTTNSSNSGLSTNALTSYDYSVNGKAITYSDALKLPDGTAVTSTEYKNYAYFTKPIITIDKTDSVAVKTEKLASLKSKLLVGTTGTSNEVGFSNLLKGLYSPTLNATAAAQSAIKPGDSVLFIMITDEDEKPNLYSLPQIETKTQKVYVRPPDYGHNLNYVSNYANYSFSIKQTNDGIASYETINIWRAPSWDFSVSKSCPQDFINQLTTKFQIVHNIPASLFDRYIGCSVETNINALSTFWFPTTVSEKQACDTLIANQKDRIISNCKLSSVTEMIGGPSLINTTSPAVTTFHLGGQFKTEFALAETDQKLYAKAFKKILTQNFARSFYFAAIVNDGSCSLSADQSVGQMFLEVKKELTDLATVIPICQPTQYAESLKNAAMMVKKTMIGTLTVTEVFKSVDQVTIVGATYRKLLKANIDYTVSGNKIQLHDGLLLNGDKVEIKLNL